MWLTLALALLVTGPPAGPGALAPHFASGTDGGLYLTWLERTPEPSDDRRADGTPARLRLARYVDGAWGEPRTIVERDDFFANWADVPSLVVSGDGSLLAHWLQKSGAGTYAYDVVVARSTDAGASWTTLGSVHDDGTETEHGFVSFVAEGDGARVFWLDGRAMAGAAHDAEHAGAMALRTCWVGTSIGSSVVLDERVCECCPTAAVATPRGPLVAYRDRSVSEIRDIALVRSAGGAWTGPTLPHADDWVIAACPVNGPALAARGDRVALAWYTGGGPDGALVRVAFSEDGGRRFGDAITVSDGWPVGRADVVLLPDGDVVVSWLDDVQGGIIAARRIRADGSRGSVFTLGPASLHRSTGIPRLALAGGSLIAVWTDEDEAGVTRLRSVVVPTTAIGAVVPPDRRVDREP